MKRSIFKVVLSSTLIASMSSADGLSLGGENVKFSKSLSLNKLEALSSNKKVISVVVKTKSPLSKQNLNKLYNDGAKRITYAGKNSFYIVSESTKIEDILKDITGMEGVVLLTGKYKLSNELKDVALNKNLRVKVEFLSSINKQELENLLNNNGIEAENIKVDDDFNIAEFDIMGISLKELSDISIVKYISKYHKIDTIKPLSSKIGVDDYYTAEDTEAKSLWGGKLGLDGLNIKIGVVDEGIARNSHQEFRLGSISRVKDMASKGSMSLHTTHVVGIIGASGIDKNARGMANEAIIYNYCFKDKYFADSLNALYKNEGILLSNHSYGFTDRADLGVYNSDASAEDRVVYSNPFINMFVAAGNDRGSDGYPDTGIIKGAANAKNVITIGALGSSSYYVASYSSVGPVRDGRIKPDLVVRGSAIYSTSSSKDNGYAYMSGTSMATPAATGMAALVMQEYKNLTKCGNSGCDMRHDLLKAVLINTAIDKNEKGPDIYTGYGMIDAKNAVSVVETLKNTKRKLKIDTVKRGETKEYNFSKESDGKFKVTISWVDPAGNSASSKSLVNDIDTYIVDKNGNKYYPYVLNGTTITKGENHVDNIEQIEVDNLPAGSYKLVVSGANLQTSSSEFAIASSEAIFDKSSSNITTREQLAMNNFAKVILKSIY